MVCGIRNVFILGGVVLFWVGGTLSVFAAVPREETPGAAERAFEESKQEKKKELDQSLQERIEKAVVETKDVAAQPQPEVEVAEAQSFFIREIKITGNTVIPTEQLKVIAATYENKTITLQDLTELTNRLTLLYKQQGYVTSRAYVPAQRLENEILEIKILEGKLGDIDVEGNRYFKEAQIRKQLEMKQGEVVNINQLEKDLNQLNSHPDRKTKAVLLPGDRPETVDFKVNVKDRFPLHANFSMNNAGTEATGVMRFEPRLTHTNLLGFDDTLNLRYQMGKHIGIIGADYRLPVGRKTTVGMNFNNVDLKLGDRFAALDIKGRARTFGISAQHLFYDGPRWDFALEGGFDYKNIKNESLNITLGEDKLRVLRLAPMLREQDEHGRTILSNSFQFGIPEILDGSESVDPIASRTGGGGEFFKYGISFARVQLFPSKASAVFRFNSQYTPDKVVAAEQFRLGGAQSIRGYEEGEFLGDSGYVMGIELRTSVIPLNSLGRRGFFEDTQGPQLQFLTFLEGGRATFKEPGAGQKGNETLVGTGLGMRLNLFKHFALRTDWGVPLQETAKSNSSGEFYFGLDTDF